MIKAQTVAYSQSPQGHKLWSGLLTFPRIILAEAKTHRILSGLLEETSVSMNDEWMLSKNSASSRAIPTPRMIQMVKFNPFVPIAWQKEHTGMQGTEYFDNDQKFNILELKDIMLPKIQKIVQLGEPETEYEKAIEKGILDQQWHTILHMFPVRNTYTLSEFWREIAIKVVDCAILLFALGVSKQIVNRLLEPFMWHTVLISGTEWENFFELRCPQYEYGGNIYRSRKDCIIAENLGGKSEGFSDLQWLMLNKGQAEIHMMALAEAIWDAMNESTPKMLQAGEWHIPFDDKIIPSRLLDNNIGVRNSSLMGGMWEEALIKVSTAMAARTSYTIVGDEKEIGYDKLIGIHDRMAVAKPFHASPFEHCAQAMSNEEYYSRVKNPAVKYTQNRDGTTDMLFEDATSENGWCRNYRGFKQYRHILESQK